MRVLLVEDHPNIALPLKEGLTKEGFVVEVEHDGILGEWRALEDDWDVIVLDIMLPGRNGYDILKAIRRRKIWTPVLMLTAKDGEYDQTDAFDLGADDYLNKPFSFMVLVARLRALVRRGKPKRPVVLEVGDLSLDPTTCEVRRNGTLIALTTREYGIVHHLMRHADEVVSKMSILDHVWDPSYEGSENIVEVYVGQIRKKIDTPFGCTTLLTVRGHGYRITAAGPGAAT
ncbi:response regulator transcription factor [Micrococcales bacterium 31B]|nr:response regulator transcription factor [Micrococcales bacterium 31B]